MVMNGMTVDVLTPEQQLAVEIQEAYGRYVTELRIVNRGGERNETSVARSVSSAVGEITEMDFRIRNGV